MRLSSASSHVSPTAKPGIAASPLRQAKQAELTMARCAAEPKCLARSTRCRTPAARDKRSHSGPWLCSAEPVSPTLTTRKGTYLLGQLQPLHSHALVLNAHRIAQAPAHGGCSSVVAALMQPILACKPAVCKEHTAQTCSVLA